MVSETQVVVSWLGFILCSLKIVCCQYLFLLSSMKTEHYPYFDPN